MHPGRLDKQVTLQTFTIAQDTLGQPVETWSTLATVWANKKDVSATERVLAQRDVSTLASVWTIRHLSGLTAKNRLQHNGTNYDIMGIRELGRQEYLELLTEAQK